MEIIAVVNQKGGVAKTTTVMNLGACLAALGKRVLVIDSDHQANLSHGLGFFEMPHTLYECLVEDLPLRDAIIDTNVPDMSLLPAELRLADSELALAGAVGRETILRDKFETANLDYDYVLIDCNPSLGLLTMNAVAAAHSLIIPVEAAFFSVDGLRRLMLLVKLIQRKISPSLHVKGVLLTRIDGRSKQYVQVQDALETFFGAGSLFQTRIHQNVAISAAQAANMPVNLYDPKSKGTADYMALAQEVIDRG